MKKRILAALLAVLMLLPMMIGAVSAAKVNHLVDKFKSEEEKLATMEKVATSGDKNIELYCDKTSGEIAIKNKQSGEILLSNPHNITDTGLKGDELMLHLSQVILNYGKIGTATLSTYSSYKDCVTYKNQLTVTPISGGISVKYKFGDGREELLLPLKIAKDDFDSVLEQIPNDDGYRSYVQNLYDLYYPYETKEDGSYVITSQGKRESMVKEFPICATTPIYVINTIANDTTKTRAADYIENYTNYTFDRLHADYDRVKEEADAGKFVTEEKPNFEFKVNYIVDNDGLIAEVDAGSLAYNKEKYYVDSITLLPYFGASDKDAKGYTFMPDGSGAIIRFEEVAKNNYSGSFYGTDYALYQISGKNIEQYTMPVFGFADTTNNIGNGFFAIIEEGDALASITSAHSLNYHYIYSNFRISASDQYDLADAFSSGTTSNNEISVIGKNQYAGKCRVKYAMLSSQYGDYEASYMGMAEYYRDYLIKNGTLSKIKADQVKDFAKIYVEMFGSIKIDETVLTFPVKVHKALTTFQDVQTIHKELTEAGVGNMTVILKGFANGGLNSTYPTSIKWQKVLGGKDGFNALLDYAKGADLEVAPDVEFTYSQGIKRFSGFSYKENGVRTLDNRYSTKREYNASTQTFERTGGVLISSASFAAAYEKFYKSASKFDITTLTVKSLGSDLNSDFDEEDYYSREASKSNIVTMLKLLSGKQENSSNKAYKLIVDMGNAYAMPYASSVLSAPLDSSRFSYQSEAIPFYGIVYHASKDFAGNPINMDGDSDYMFLKALENGAALYFTVAMQNTEYLKFDMEYNKYYSVKYSILKEQILSLYKEYNELMKDKQDKYIVKHEFMNEEYGYKVYRKEDNRALNNSNVVLVVYEGGEGFILNYNSYDVVVEYEGKTYEIAPFGYEVYPKADKEVAE